MSDDEELIYVKKANTIHYGSLEESERLKQQTLEEIESDEEEFAEPEPKVAKTVATPAPVTTTNNVHTSNEYFDLEQEVYVLWMQYKVNQINVFFLDQKIK